VEICQLYTRGGSLVGRRGTYLPNLTVDAKAQLPGEFLKLRTNPQELGCQRPSLYAFSLACRLIHHAFILSGRGRWVTKGEFLNVLTQSWVPDASVLADRDWQSM
jgi:hypothetical protein